MVNRSKHLGTTIQREPRDGAVDRDVILRIDGLLIGARGDLDGVAHYMKNNLSGRDYAEVIQPIGRTMTELIDISSRFRSRFPDIAPKELRPFER